MTKTASSNSMAKKYLLAANFFIETNRMEPYVAVFLIAIHGWSEYLYGIVSLAMNLSGMFFQVPAGDLFDKTPYKKTVTATAILIASVTTTCVVWTTNFWIILSAKIIEGIAAAVFLPALMSILFGICTTVEEVPKTVTANETSNKIGSALFVLCCGLMGYYLYPNIDSIFYLLGAGGIGAACFIAAIPSSAIDPNRARQLRLEAVGEGDDNNDDTELGTTSSSEDEVKDIKAVSYMELFLDKQVIAFTVATFFYHFANASVVPLVTQYLAIGNARTSMVYVSAALLVGYVFQAITTQVIIVVIDKVTPKALFVCAHLVLIARCVLIAVMIGWWDNKYALTATQVLDGIGAGIYDTLIPIVTGQLTEGTGRFGVTYGLLLTSWRLGHASSLFVGEYIAYEVSYLAAFITLGSFGVVSMLFLIGGVHLPPLGEVQRISPFFDEKLMRQAFKKRVLTSVGEMGLERSIHGLHQVFNSIDAHDGDGELDRGELKLFLEKASCAADAEKAEDVPIDTDVLFDYIDVSGDGKIQFIEFILYLEEDGFSPQIKLLQDKARLAVHGKLAEDDLIKAFKLADADHGGSLCKKELSQFLDVNGVEMSDVEIDVMYRFMDANDEGGIDAMEFIDFIKYGKYEVEEDVKPNEDGGDMKPKDDEGDSWSEFIDFMKS